MWITGIQLASGVIVTRENAHTSGVGEILDRSENIFLRRIRMFVHLNDIFCCSVVHLKLLSSSFSWQSAGGVGDEDAGDDDGQDGAWLPQVGGVLEIAEALT